MTEYPVTGIPLREALERLGPTAEAILTAAPIHPGSQRAEETISREPVAVLARDGEVVYALFRVPDPAKEQPKDE